MAVGPDRFSYDRGVIYRRVGRLYFFVQWKRTYLHACFFALTFPVMNAQLFNIGIFPWLMIAAAIVLYYPFPWPDPGKLWIKGARRLRRSPRCRSRPGNVAERPRLSVDDRSGRQPGCPGTVSVLRGMDRAAHRTLARSRRWGIGCVEEGGMRRDFGIMIFEL